MEKTSSFKADSLSITPQIPEIEADTVTCNPLRTHLLGFPYDRKPKESRRREGRVLPPPPMRLAIYFQPCRRALWPRQWMMAEMEQLELSKALLFSQGWWTGAEVAEGNRPQCPVMHKQSQQVAGQSWVLDIAGSSWHLGTRSSCPTYSAQHFISIDKSEII